MCAFGEMASPKILFGSMASHFFTDALCVQSTLGVLVYQSCEKLALVCHLCEFLTKNEVTKLEHHLVCDSRLKWLLAISKNQCALDSYFAGSGGFPLGEFIV
jgi:hypothetical protein